MLNPLLLTGLNFLEKGFRNLTFLIDKGIYSLAKVAYAVFYYLSNASILDDSIVKNVTVRMYTILSIVMVFVLAFNLLNYIIDPDKVNDKKIGASAFVKDVIIALVIISMTPMLFTKLYSFQSTVISSGVIPTLILGGANNETAADYELYEQNKNNYSSLTDYYIQNGANTMVSSIYAAFLYPNDGKTSLDCTNEEYLKDTTFNYYCEAYKTVKHSGNIAPYGDFVSNGDYNYTPFLSTAAGLVLLYFMLIFCISLAKRVGKLAIIQLIAPVPVTLELLPNKKGLRKNWIDTLIKVYIEVFMYLLVMYLIIFLISLIPGTVGRLFGNMTEDGISLVKIITVVLLTFGLLLFAKDAPKLLMDLLGIKGMGLVTDAMKSLKPVGGMAAFLGGTAGSMVGNAIRNFNSTDGNVFQKLGSGVGGASSTFFRNAWGARNVHSIKDANNLRRNVNKNVVTARVNRDAYAHAHSGFMGSTRGHLSDMGRTIGSASMAYTGLDNDYLKIKHQDEVLQEYKKLYNDSLASIWRNDAQYSQADSEFKRYDNMIKSGAVMDGSDYLRFKRSGASATSVDSVTGKTLAELEALSVDKNTGLTYGELQNRAKTMRDSRQAEVLKDKKLQFMEAAGRLNNFIDAHQGVKGVTSQRIKIDDIGSISTAADAQAQLDALTDIVETGYTRDSAGNIKKDTAGNPILSGDGFKPNLKDIEKNTVYQQQRVQEKLRSDAKQANKKAAEQASNKNDKK